MRLIFLAAILIVTAFPIIIVKAQDAPKRSAELQVLDRYIGEWETVVTVKDTGEKLTSIENRKWSREGKFVLSENFDFLPKREAHFLFTYDSKAKQYRACFINEEFTVPLLGQWDEIQKTMRWQSSGVAFKHDSVHRFIDNEHSEWTMTVTSPEGKVVLELSAKQTRRKK